MNLWNNLISIYRPSLKENLMNYLDRSIQIDQKNMGLVVNFPLREIEIAYEILNSQER